MQKLVTSAQIRSFESDFIKDLGQNNSLVLMERAGFALAQEAKEHKEPYLIVCGKGNNGGDGFVAAKYLYDDRKKVVIVLTAEESSLSNEAKINFRLIKDKVNCLKIDGKDYTEFRSTLASSNTVLDCLLGTGSQGKLSPLFSKIIKEINDSGKIVIACDIPTGINSDTGNISNHVSVIKANVTVTFGYPKLGLFVYPAKKYAGKIKTIDIGLSDIKTNYFLLDDSFLKENFPKRAEDANKGKFGRTLLICGSKKYPGAALLASKAASSIGSGLTSLSSPTDVLSKIAAVIPEVTHVEFNSKTILEESLNSTVLVVGPGLTTTEEIQNLVKTIITKVNIPIVLDADGINVLSGSKNIAIKSVKKDIVLTPHPKEFARFLGISVDEVLDNKIEFAKATAANLNCTIVLKGPGTIIATKNEEIYISPFANAALAKGGTGDVLAGFIGGLIAQGLSPSLASCVGVYIHGKTAELVTSEKTVFSLLPQDLIMYLPNTIKNYT